MGFSAVRSNALEARSNAPSANADWRSNAKVPFERLQKLLLSGWLAFERGWGRSNACRKSALGLARVRTRLGPFECLLHRLLSV